MAQGELLLQRAVGRHPVVVAPRQIADLGMKGRAERHRQLLKPAAKAKYRLPASDRGPDQGQRHAIAGAVERAMGLGGLVAILLRMNVGAAAGEHEAVKDRQKLVDPRCSGTSGEAQRHAVGHVANGIRVHHAVGMGRVLIVDEVAVRDDADDRAHASPPVGGT
jgi:hypothetical protein